jgi:uncharacterized membrane protein
MNIEQYAAAVGAELADLPESVRAELMEDLPEHLAEVAAEAETEGVTLVDRVGPPATYAAELRASLGHDAPARPARRIFARTAQLKARLRPLDTRLGHIIGYARLSDLLRQLRPAWWVLRGYLAALFIGVASGEPWGFVPRFSGSAFVGSFLTAGCIIGSLWLAKAVQRRFLAARIASVAASIVLVLFGFNALSSMTGVMAGNGYHPQESVYVDSSSLYGDVVVVDQKGHPVGPVGVVDLDSQTYLNFTVHTCENMLPWEGNRWPLLHTLCAERPSPSPSPTITTPVPSASPTP